MVDDESRAARQRALAEKKRRLEEIKARRRQPASSSSASSSTGGGGAAAAPSSGSVGLDSYIDDLLKTSTPGLTLAPAAPPTPAAATGEETKTKTSSTGEEKGGKGDDEAPSSADEAKALGSGSSASAATSGAAAHPPRPCVETFEIAVQCEEDDFPPPSLIDEDDPGEQKEVSDSDNGDDEANDGGNLPFRRGFSTGSAILRSASHGSVPLENAASGVPTPPPLSSEEKSKVISSPPFNQFLSAASKRVERLLGAGEESLYGILDGSGWGASGGADFSADYAKEDEEEYDDEEEDAADGAGSRKKRRSKKTKEEAYQAGGFFTARATYEFPKFTGGRCVTDIEWCPGHKEWVLASYNAVAGGVRVAEGEPAGGGGASGAIASRDPSTRRISPNDPASSFLQSASSAIPNEGIVAIYNLSMPSRPEHVFCAGCPILHSTFHPTEHPKLVLGGASSGQVLVWDARVGRYPVQRSSALGGGHDCELVGMKVVGDEGGGGGGVTTAAGTGSISASKLVTASSDGMINFWSPSNLREPAEHIQVDANLSCLEILHGTGNEGMVCGDEMGGLHLVSAGTGRDGSGSSKRVVRTLHRGGSAGIGPDAAPGAVEESPDAAGESAETGHYGMVTAVAARPVMSHTTTPRGSIGGETAEGTSRGFLRGAGGLMVTTGVDWSTKLWAPAYGAAPLMSFLSNSYDYMCDVQWNPIHPSVFATASSNGSVNIWNLASSLDQPVSGTEGVPVNRISDSASSRKGLNRLRWSSDGRRMAVASGDKLHVLGVGEDVWKSKGDEAGRMMHNLVSRGLIHE